MRISLGDDLETTKKISVELEMKNNIDFYDNVISSGTYAFIY